MKIQKIPIWPKLAIAVFVVAGSFMLFGGRAEAATITVGGGCTLSDAITATNNDSDEGSCVSVGAYGADTINIPSGTTTRTDNTLATDDLSIVGAGAGTTIVDGDDSYSGLICQHSGGGLLDFSISNLTIQNTGSGSGAYPIAAYNCNLDLENIEITDGEEAVGNIFFTTAEDGATADLTVNDVYIHDTEGNGLTIQLQGQGVDDAVDAVIDGLTVASHGVSGLTTGGIMLISGNSDTASTHTSDILVRNSTFIGDDTYDTFGVMAQTQSSVNGVTDNIDIALQNVTIVDHDIASDFPASGVLAAAYAGSGGNANIAYTLKNVLMANNTAASSPATCLGMPFGGGGTEVATITSLGNNIVDDASCSFAQSGDQQSVAGLIDTLDDPAANGGFGRTLALLDGSPAIDGGGVVAGISTDQRGVSRPQGSAFDVGSYELEQESSGGDSEEPSGGDQQGSNNSQDSDGETTTLADSGSTPGVPDTGFGFKLLKTNPLLTLIVSTSISAALYLTARYYKRASS